MTGEYKVVLLGEGRVGKTSLVSRFVENTFDPNTRSTTQAARGAAAAPTVSLHIWDTAGQERFHALGPIYYRNAHGAMLVYDITDADTLEKVHMWIRELRAVVGDHIQLVICGNKADREEERDIPRERAEAFAKEHNALHFTTSAKTGMNVTEAFRALATVIAQSTSIFRSTGTGEVGGIRSGNSVDAVTARRRRGQLRIKEEDEDDTVRKEEGQEYVLKGKVITGSRRTNPSSSSLLTTTGIVTAAGRESRGKASVSVSALSKEDYMYDDRRYGNKVRSGLVDLRVQPPQRTGNRGKASDNENKSSDSSGRYSCCA